MFRLLSVGFCVSIFGFAAEPRPVQLQDYYRLESASTPAISPDGRRVAFVRTRIIEAENRRHNEIWIAPSDGSGAPSRLTDPPVNASNPRWSPDGKLLAYTVAKDETPWFLRMDSTGAPMRIDGVGGPPIFSPDNRWIAFTKKTPPMAKAPGPELSEADRLIQQRFKGRIYDWMNFRFDGRGYLPDPRDPFATPPQELYIVPRSGGVAKQLTHLNVDVQAVAWRPDSAALAFVANASQRDEHLYEHADLWTVAFDGEMRRLTNDGFHHSAPAWSLDGRSIAVLREQGLDQVLAARQQHGSPIDVVLVPAQGGSPANLTAEWDLMPGAPQWGKDGQAIYFPAEIGGTAHLFRLTVSSARVEQVTEGDRVLSGLTIAPGVDRIAYVATSPDRPTEVFTANLKGSNERKLSSIQDQLLQELKLGRTERFRFDSKDGTSIDGWAVFPPDYDKSHRYPLIADIHGGPHGAFSSSFSYPQQLLAAAGYIVIYVNPRGSTGYGEKFRWGTWGGWGEHDLEDVMAGVDYALKHYSADPKRLGVTGYSYGGFLTNWIIGHTDRFRAAITGAGPTNWISNYGTGDIPRTKESEFLGRPWEPEAYAVMVKQSPITYAKNIHTPTLFIHGESDARVPIAQAEELYTALKKQNVPAKFIRYPNSYHGNWAPWDTVHRYQQELIWWKQYLGVEH